MQSLSQELFQEGSNWRRYGMGPLAVVAVHGGPGAVGELAPLARELGKRRGVLEALQTADSLNGQIAELKECLEQSDLPVTLVGHSYGALLSLITAARYPAVVKKLILIGSAVFEDRYATEIMAVRRARLSETDNAELDALFATFEVATEGAKDCAFARLGALLGRADGFDLLPEADEVMLCRYDIYVRVWPEVAEFRASGQLLSCVKDLRCPVVAIHGEYDPHPAAGVREPLERLLRDFKFILLEECGHVPWREKRAREAFYRAIESELGP